MLNLMLYWMLMPNGMLLMHMYVRMLFPMHMHIYVFMLAFLSLHACCVHRCVCPWPCPNPTATLQLDRACLRPRDCTRLSAAGNGEDSELPPQIAGKLERQAELYNQSALLNLQVTMTLASAHE